MCSIPYFQINLCWRITRGEAKLELEGQDCSHRHAAISSFFSLVADMERKEVWDVDSSENTQKER